MRIVDESTVEVRAERQSKGDGRVYRIEFADADGHSRSREIHVPTIKAPSKALQIAARPSE